ncbi:MAG: aminopeptidase P family protein [Lachnospiraceae bacterium]|nr:aminopeptidase P family protein [Lachnospiraceae bacterium]
MSRIHKERIEGLRGELVKKGIDWYIIPTADFHNSEYVSNYFNVREYYSGFTGSNGTLIVSKAFAGLWTDGRYFIQAQKELSGSGVELFKLGNKGVPKINDFLKEHIKDGETLGFDARVMSAFEVKELLEKKLKETKVTLKCDEDVAGSLMEERAPFPKGEIYVLSDEISGRSVRKKLCDLREKLSGEGADSIFISKLDDIMWLYNIRGWDVYCNPVAMSYTYVNKDKAVLFIQKDVLKEEDKKYFSDNDVELREYVEAGEFLKGKAGNSASEEKILLDIKNTNYHIYSIANESLEVIEGKNPTTAMKAVKNEIELRNMEEIFLKDSVALTKFIYWLKQNIGKLQITEISAADKLEEFRREIPEFLGLSFPTISAYGANAAMMHYEATKDSYSTLSDKGMLLVDSGAQYFGGTTDVTRTIVLGELSDEEKRDYSLVAEGFMQLTHARFLKGCTGRNLDILARKPLWDKGIDYKCGTGHGVGYILNVHEGPQSMRWKFNREMEEAEFLPGMDITNEPGVYIEGKYGIRLENVMVCEADAENEYGEFLKFKTLTWVPVDMRAVKKEYMTESGYEYILEYQRKVYEKLSPFLSEDERSWLKNECMCAEPT